MTSSNDSNPMPERPRSEPEIIPPGADDGRGDSVWGRYNDGYGVHRITIARPGWPTMLLGLFILGAIITLGFLVIAGVLLLWLPMMIAGILLALFYGPVRDRWRRWFGGRP